MNSTRPEPRASEKWFEDFVVELRMRGVSGDEIGDALAVVKDHCAASGESPEEAFGAAADYAHSLELHPAGLDVGGALSALAPALLLTAGVVVVLDTVTAYRNGTLVPVSWGSIVGLALLVILGLALTWQMRELVRRPVLGGAVLAAFFAALLAAQVVWSTAAFSMPVWLGALVGVLAVAGFWWWLRVLRRAEDPVRDPVSGQEVLPPIPHWAGVLAWTVPALLLLGAVIAAWQS